MADSNLARIRLKVRRITTSPSPNDLSNDEIDDAINTAYTIDMPERLRLFDLKRDYSFETQPGVDTYEFPKNRYVLPISPFYAAGYQLAAYRDPNSFTMIYPNLQYKQTFAQSDGGASYTGVLSNVPFLQGHVLVTGLNPLGTALNLRDEPTSNLLGNLVGDGTGTVNYATGEITVNFSGGLAPSSPVQAQTVLYKPSRPQSILFYDNKFVLRPVPNDSYTISMSCYITPTEMLASTDEPDQAFMWQYLAQMAAKKIFEDRQNFDAIAANAQLLQEYQDMVEARSFTNAAQSRAQTIYDMPNYYIGNIYPTI